MSGAEEGSGIERRTSRQTARGRERRRVALSRKERAGRLAAANRLTITHSIESRVSDVVVMPDPFVRTLAILSAARAKRSRLSLSLSFPSFF